MLNTFLIHVQYILIHVQYMFNTCLIHVQYVSVYMAINVRTIMTYSEENEVQHQGRGGAVG
jgi:hypothetical protein